MVASSTSARIYGRVNRSAIVTFESENHAFRGESFRHHLIIAPILAAHKTQSSNPVTLFIAINLTLSSTVHLSMYRSSQVTLSLLCGVPP